MAKSNKNLHILIFASGFAPYSASENLVNSKLSLAFLKKGWQTEVISRADEGFNYGVNWNPPWMPLKAIANEVRYEAGNKVSRHIDVIRSILKTHHIQDGVRWARRAYELALQLHKKNPFQVVLSRSPDTVSHLPAMIFARKTGLPWIANWNDPPGHLMPYPYKDASNRIRRFINENFIRKVFNDADLNTFPCERLRDYIYRKLNLNKNIKDSVIPHIGFSNLKFQQPDHNGLFKLCHAGNLSSERNPKILFSALKRFISDCNLRDKFFFEVIGIEDVGLIETARQFGIESNLVMTGRVSYLESLERLYQNDVLLVLEAPCEEGVFLPSKVADYARTGRPVFAVSPNNGTMNDILSRFGGGISADCLSPQSICHALTKLYHSWRNGDIQAEYGSEKLCHLFLPETIITQYEDIFDHLNIPFAK